jgi:uncharacterized protein
MSKAQYTVKESGIHGKGLFALIPINEGDVIGSIKYNPVEKDGPYVLWLSESVGIQVDCDLKYINHNPAPNACYCEDLQVIALQNIEIGEEITHDYGDDWK